MLDSWFNFLRLATEAQEVVGLRLLRLGWGGAVAQDEALLMMSEKVDSSLATVAALVSGASPDGIVETLRLEVQANARRLTGRA